MYQNYGLKRKNFDNGGGGGPGGHFQQGKRFRGPPPMQKMDPSNMDIRLLIMSRYAGPIIGKGGENIKKLKTENKANVIIAESTAPERILQIKGTLEAVCNVVKGILPKFEEHRQNVNSEECDVKLMIHKSQAGCVIGKGGEKIKELRESTNTKIKVCSEPCPGSTDRVVNISGPVDNMVECMKLVLQLCCETPPKGPSMLYDPANYDPSLIVGYGGFPPDHKWRPMGPPGGGPRPGFMPPHQMGGGGGGGPPMGGAPQMGPRPTMPAPQYFGEQQQQYGGHGGQQPPYGMQQPYPGGGMQQGSYGGPPGMPPMGSQGGGGQGPVETSQVTVPKDMAGAIIGKGGEKIISIKQESGAKVIVEPPEAGSNERVITITGTQQSIQMAQYLLQQCVRQNSYNRKFTQDNGHA